MGRAARIEAILTEAFRPQALDIRDESEAHRGHAGYRDGGETHYRVFMRAASLNGLGRVERQRMVYRALAPELDSGLHALALDVDGTDAAAG